MARRVTALFASAARTATTNSVPVHADAKGATFVLNVTAASGTSPTLDVKLQTQVIGTTTYVDVPGAAFAQKTSTGADTLTVYPGVAETSNRSVSDVLPATYRAVATIGGTTPSFTFTLDAYEVD